MIFSISVQPNKILGVFDLDNQLMLIIGNIEISWFAVFTSVACFIGLLIACLLRAAQRKDIGDVFVCTTFGVPLGLLFGRILYILFSGSSLSGWQLINITNGGYGLYGVILGVFLGAVIAKIFYKADGLGQMLDCLAVGGSLAIAIGRFATCFTSSEIGYEVRFKAFAVYDSEQNLYNLAVYKLDGIYELSVFGVCLWFFIHCKAKTDSRLSSGKTCMLMLALHGTNEVVMESMRADPLKLGLNEFIKISQILGITCCVVILVAFMIISARLNGFGKFHIISIPLILVAIVLGVFGEYRVGSSNYISNHLIMFAGMVLLNWLTIEFALQSVAKTSAPAMVDVDIASVSDEDIAATQEELPAAAQTVNTAADVQEKSIPVESAAAQPRPAVQNAAAKQPAAQYASEKAAEKPLGEQELDMEKLKQLLDNANINN